MQEIILGLVCAAVLSIYWQIGHVVERLKAIENLLRAEMERQHTERLSEDGRDRQGRFASGASNQK